MQSQLHQCHCDHQTLHRNTALAYPRQQLKCTVAVALGRGAEIETDIDGQCGS